MMLMRRTLMILGWVLGLSATSGVARGVAVPPPPLPAVEFHAETIATDCYITVISSTTAKLGRAVEWANDDAAGSHTISESSGLWARELGIGDTVEGSAVAAGGFTQSCDGGPDQAWKVKIKAKARSATPDFKVTWALAGAKASWHYNVQYRIGAGSWRTWKPNTSIKSATFDGVSGKAYGFRSRVINIDSGDRTGWSPIFKVST